MALLTPSEQREVEAILVRAGEQTGQLSSLLELASEWDGDVVGLQFIHERTEQINNMARIDGERLHEQMSR